MNYWWDRENLKAGNRVLATLEKALKKSRAVLVCVSRNQIESGWSRAEYETILNSVFSGHSDHLVVPLVLDELEEDKIPFFLRNYKWERLSDSEAYAEMLRPLGGKL